MDYFGKRDLIFIDMTGDQDVAKLSNLNNFVRPDLDWNEWGHIETTI
jgi:hypothetical protein